MNNTIITTNNTNIYSTSYHYSHSYYSHSRNSSNFDEIKQIDENGKSDLII